MPVLVIKNAKDKGYKVLDCTGEAVASGAFESNLQEIAVPTAGMVIIGE